jgi:5-methyltetrahydropteroyltriglutamate--homocysteine S-methyltransferase
MNNVAKPFSTTLIGSMPRSRELLKLKEKSIEDKTYLNEYRKKLFSETEEVIHMLEDTGIDVVISGELSRDNYMSYVAEHVPGIKLMTMEDIKNITGNTEEFNKSLEEMDAADNSMNSPACIDKISTDVELNTEEVNMIRNITDKPFKMTLPSPYLLTRSMWLKEITGKVYADRKELGNDIVKLLINEIRRLVKVGAKIIQIDEPILSEVVFTRKKGDNSFY